MARIIANKFPIDEVARRAVGFSLPMNGSAVFKSTYQTRDQVKSNLINYLLTNKGERFFNVRFGANLRALMFENIQNNTLDNLQEEIQSRISEEFPMVTVNQIEFVKDPDSNSIQFILTYQVENFDIEDYISITLQ